MLVILIITFKFFAIISLGRSRIELNPYKDVAGCIVSLVHESQMARSRIYRVIGEIGNVNNRMLVRGIHFLNTICPNPCPRIVVSARKSS